MLFKNSMIIQLLYVKDNFLSDYSLYDKFIDLNF